MSRPIQSIRIRVGDFILSPFPEDTNPNGIYEVVGFSSSTSELKIRSISTQHPGPREHWIPAKPNLFYRPTTT